MTSQEQRDKVLRMMHNQNTTLEISGQLGIPVVMRFVRHHPITRAGRQHRPRKVESSSNPRSSISLGNKRNPPPGRRACLQTTSGSTDRRRGFDGFARFVVRRC